MAPVTSNLNTELIWDRSFPKPNKSPEGLAADGVARLYFKVSKLNQTGSDIKTVTVSILVNFSVYPVGAEPKQHVEQSDEDNCCTCDLQESQHDAKVADHHELRAKA